MKKTELSSIELFFRDKITDRNAVFVFPTDVAAQSWAEWCVTNGHTAVHSVAQNRFLAWDQFKGNLVSAQKEHYRAVPSILRNLFVYDLIAQNAASPFLKKLIRPEFAGGAYSFAPWLAKNLPSLHMWKQRMEQNRASYGALDDEDRDYDALYERYSAFLEKNQLFEPAWIDSISFKDTAREFYILFPEQLADFSDFDQIFSGVQNVTALVLPKDTPSPRAYFYSDARRELRQTMLRMISLVKQKKADWTEIALSVPDLDTYRPYIQREFGVYGIPYVLRAGVSLTKNNAGRIFREINDCHAEHFSFDTLRTLLCDECIPWKETILLDTGSKEQGERLEAFNLTELREALIREGSRMRCITSYEDGKTGTLTDIWESALGATYAKNKRLLKFYRKLKNDVNRFFSSENRTFKSIRSAWFTFKDDFINDADFSSDANKILGRCLSHLEEIIRVESDYAALNLTIDSPFQFFLSVLDSKIYTPKTDAQGVSVVPYKLTACAYFKYQFVIAGSQKGLDVPYKPLAFLSSQKRRKLNLTEDDRLYNATETIAKLYARTVEGVPADFVHFSASEAAFEGFAIPHSVLSVEQVAPDFDDEDFIRAEEAWIRGGAEQPISLSGRQKKSLEHWAKASCMEPGEYRAGGRIMENIAYVLREAKNKALSDAGLLTEALLPLNKISARGEMEKFFPCPRKWILSQVLKLHDDSLDTDLMKIYDMGNLHHKILESFMEKYKGCALPYCKDGRFFASVPRDEGASGGDSALLNAETDVTEQIRALFYGENDGEAHIENNKNLTSLVKQAILFRGFDFCDSPLVTQTLLSQKTKIADTLIVFLEKLLVPFATADSCEDGAPKNINGIGNCTVLSVEEPHVAMQEAGFAYYGKADCVVRTPDEKQLIILDYKNTGNAIPAKKEFTAEPDTKLLEDFQMAVYCRLLSSTPQETLAAAYFYGITDGARTQVFDKYERNKEKSDKTPVPPNDYAVFSSTVSTCDEYAALMNRMVQAEKPDFLPYASQSKTERLSVKKYEHCPGCAFRTICRTTYEVAGVQPAEKPETKGANAE